jgi:hypothetical protein
VTVPAVASLEGWQVSVLGLCWVWLVVVSDGLMVVMVVVVMGVVVVVIVMVVVDADVVGGAVSC